MSTQTEKQEMPTEAHPVDQSELIKALGTEVAILVEWLDSASNPGWLSKDECKVEVSKCQTLGFLVDETDDGICLALNRTVTAGYKPYGELVSIPKVAILNAYYLPDG